jgi:hypothetical protein
MLSAENGKSSAFHSGKPGTFIRIILDILDRDLLFLVILVKTGIQGWLQSSGYPLQTAGLTIWFFP